MSIYSTFLKVYSMNRRDWATQTEQMEFRATDRGNDRDYTVLVQFVRPGVLRVERHHNMSFGVTRIAFETVTKFREWLDSWVPEWQVRAGHRAIATVDRVAPDAQHQASLAIGQARCAGMRDCVDFTQVVFSSGVILAMTPRGFMNAAMLPKTA